MLWWTRFYFRELCAWSRDDDPGSRAITRPFRVLAFVLAFRRMVIG
jgi:hypothetical protein